MEENLRRALLVNDGSFAFLWERPITAVLLAISIACVMMPVVGKLRAMRAARR
jgi:putative tricarboxylic transport membrane protein